MRIGRALLGLTLIGLGSLFLMDLAGWLDAWAVIGAWWPVAFVVLGLVQFLDMPRPILAPTLLAGFGAVMLLFTTGVIDVNPGLVFLPLLAIVAGLLFLFGGRTSTSREGGDTLTAMGIFGGSEARSSSRHFRGATMLAMFGAATVDLSDADVEERAVIDVLVAFGGAEVIVPEHWQVAVSGIPVFGGWSNKAKRPQPEPYAPLLRVNVLVAFGGFEVKLREREMVPA